MAQTGAPHCRKTNLLPGVGSFASFSVAGNGLGWPTYGAIACCAAATSAALPALGLDAAALLPAVAPLPAVAVLPPVALLALLHAVTASAAKTRPLSAARVLIS